ncbi:MAG: hypothetical protein AAGE52_39080 [Myxococcota bacterium]
MLNHRTIFLFDGVGAVVTAVSLGLILPAVHEWIGMPVEIVRALGIAGVGFALYSFGCFRFADTTRRHWLAIVMIANSSYCVLSAILTAVHWELLKPLGVAYFLGEIVVLIAVVAIERRVYRTL